MKAKSVYPKEEQRNNTINLYLKVSSAIPYLFLLLKRKKSIRAYNFSVYIALRFGLQ